MSGAGPFVGLGIGTLAWLTHRAEDSGDDLRFLALQAEIERRPAVEQEAYRLEYVRQHAALAAADAREPS